MKKTIYLSLLIAACMISSLVVSAAAPGNRVFYGFNLGSAEWSDGASKTYDCGFVSYPLDLSEEGTVLKSYLPRPTVGAFAGACKDGIIYAALYEYGFSPMPTDLVAYNIYNGTEKVIGKWNPEQTNFKPLDMTYDAVSDKMYAIADGLYEVDLNTATFTKICPLNSGGGTLAADAKGTLWTIGQDGILCSVNTDENGEFTGRVTKVFDTGLRGMMTVQSMEFDYATGKLYWASNTLENPHQSTENIYLQEIDMTDPEHITIREVGRIGIMSRLVAMYIPSAQSLDAPAAPTNIRSKAGQNGTLEATLTWVNPTTSFGGGEIGNLYGVLIKRDGKQVAYIKEKPVAGKEMSWKDTDIPETGNYRYEIQVVNGNGNGAKGIAYQFVGYDKPSEVTDITGAIGTDMQSIVLSWGAPTIGANNGSLDLTKTRYTVTRNDGTVVAENISDCSITDKDFKRLMSYNYTITATNDKGESSTKSPSFILGPAKGLPMEQTFESEASVRNSWTVIDGNNDLFSWLFATNLGHSTFGDYEPCAEYIVSPTLGNEHDADEWLITPPLAFEANEQYIAVVSSRAYSIDRNGNGLEELIDVHFGSQNAIDAMGDKLGTVKVRDNGIDPITGTVAFKESTIELPIQTEDAIRCVGFHLVTPIKEMLAGFLQINNIKVCRKSEYDGVADISIDRAEVSIALNGRTLTIFGEFNAATLYNLQGTAVANTTTPAMNLEGLTPGIYVLSIDSQSFKIIL